MSSWVSGLVIAGTLVSLVAFFLILQMNRSVSRPGKTTGHNYDGIEEYDNPLPAWWYWGFLFTIVFGIGYLIYYPGLGNFPGIGGWSQVGELKEQQALAEERYGPMFARYGDIPVDELAQDPEVVKIGRRLFTTNCSVCHGATGTGSFGFPNLTDSEWQWGHANEAILSSISGGRNGVMTPFGSILSSAEVSDVASHVMTLSGQQADPASAARGAGTFNTYCAVCHTAAGTGNELFGAPDLTNDIWLYGGTRERIEHIIRTGRNSMMPAFGEKLGEDKVRILAAYVKSLGAGAPAGPKGE